MGLGHQEKLAGVRDAQFGESSWNISASSRYIC